MKNFTKLLLATILSFMIFGCSSEELTQKEESSEETSLFKKESEINLKKQATCGYTDSFEFNSQPNGRHYHANTLVSDENITILVFSNLSEPPGILEGTSWRRALDDAITDWNSFSECRVLFQSTEILSEADIVVDGPDQLNGGWPSGADHIFGWVDGNPRCGKPYPQALINTNFVYSDGSLPSQNNMRNIIAHELGHAIGFRHTDGNGGTPISTTGIADIESLMHSNVVTRTRIGLTDDDITATEYLYGCNSTVNDNEVTSPFVYALRPRPFCYTDDFDISGTFMVCDSNVTNLQLCIKEAGVLGQPIYCTPITQFSNGNFNFTELNLSTIPGFDVTKNYQAIVTMTDQSPLVSDVVNINFNEDCDPVDECPNLCETYSPEFDVQQNLDGTLTFSVINPIVDFQCVNSFYYHWTIVNPENLAVSYFLGHSITLNPSIYASHRLHLEFVYTGHPIFPYNCKMPGEIHQF